MSKSTIILKTKRLFFLTFYVKFVETIQLPKKKYDRKEIQILQKTVIVEIFVNTESKTKKAKEYLTNLSFNIYRWW
jgi:sucrose-6-phosphate hydrolase SacC (GH32 family)